MKLLSKIWLFCILGFTAHAQQHFTDKCVVHFYQVVDFTGPSITVDISNLNYSKFYATAHSSICDSTGTLQFSTNGYFIMNRLGQVMDNGDTICGKEICKFHQGFSPAAQSVLILPFPGNQYRVICNSADDNEVLNYWPSANIRTCFNTLSFSTVDMNANGGLGKVTEKYNIFYQQDSLGRTGMMVCRHANGKDWWLLNREWYKGGIIKHLITKDSIYYMGKDTFPNIAWPLDNSGQLMFSPDGSHFALTVRISNLDYYNNPPNYRAIKGRVFYADFDRCIGEISNPQWLEVPTPVSEIPGFIDSADNTTQGLCFSPNGRFIYVSKFSAIYQYDTQDPDTNTCWYKVMDLDTTNPPFQFYASLFPAPNGKVYIGNWGGVTKEMSVIENPNQKGAACNVCKRCAVFPSYVSCMPDWPNYNLGPLTPCWPLEEEETLPLQKNIVLYPNPTYGQINISYLLKAGEQGLLEILDLSGRVVKQLTLKNQGNTLSTHLEGIALGVYLYKFKVNSMLRQSGKLIYEAP